MSEPPELWTFVLANSVSSILALLMTALSYFAARARGLRSFRYATVGFGLLTLATFVEPGYQLVWRGDYNLSGRELLAMQTVEALFLGLGFAVLFYSIYAHSAGPSGPDPAVEAAGREGTVRDEPLVEDHS